MSDARPPGYLLAGGRSRRLGFDKRTAEVGGRTLLELATAVLAEAADPVTVVARRDSAPEWGGRVLLDDGPDPAAIHGLRAALEDAERGGARSALVIPVDLPALRPGTLRAITSAAADSDALCVAVLDSGIVQPFPAAWRPEALPAIRQAIGEGRLALRHLLDSIPVLVLPAEQVGLLPGELSGVNTPGELESARQRVREVS